MKATRDSFGDELALLGEKHPEIVVLDADLAKSTKSLIFGKKFPERFFEMGIAEANMIGTAAGLALSGKTAFACSFGCFLTGRYDQIRMSVAYNQANVKLVGTHSGVAIGEDGHSQMGLEDISLLRALPHFSIFQPADDQETRAMVRYLVQNEGPVYLRLTRQKVPTIFPQPIEFHPGRWPVLHEGKGIAILASGGLVASAFAANADRAKPWTVINASSLKPIDTALIKRLCTSHDWIVTAEDHYTIGGLGSAVAEVMAEVGGKAKLFRIGVETFGESGDPEEIFRHFGFDAQSIGKKVDLLKSA